MKLAQKGKVVIPLLLPCLLWLSLAEGARAQSADVLTYHNDNARSGQNLNETVLTPANVGSASFGKLWVLPVDGRVDAQPLYAAGVTIPSLGLRNVLFVVTEHDSVYGFDADSASVLWHVSMLGGGETPSDSRSCEQISPEIGITSTPVIDRQLGPNGTIFVVAMSRQGSSTYIHRLHALDLATGSDRVTATTISATYPGTGDNSSGGNVIFDPAQYKERASLLLLNGVVYTAWASHCDNRPYTGWIMGYNEQTLAQTSVWNVTPNGNDGAIWMSGAGLAADAGGNIYFLDGNGTFDTTLTSGGFPINNDFGNSFIKLSTAGNGLTPLDYFATYTTPTENSGDMDLGSGGALLLPDMTDTNGQTRQLAVGAGKDANIYLVDRSNMGKFNPNNNNAIYQELANALPGGVWAMPAFWNGTLYYGSVGGPLKAFSFQSARLSGVTSQTAGSFAYPGTTPSISANGNANGIVWASENTSPAVLHAYAATNLAVELYNSSQAANSRDHFGMGNKFITPMIANGKVYVGTTNGVGVFGELNVTAPPLITAQPGSQIVVTGANVSFTATASGTAPLIYQWRFNGANLVNGSQFSGATTATLGLANAQTANAGSYLVVVTNVAGAVTSSVATLTVTVPPPNVPPVITAQPASQIVVTGANTSFTAAASGTAPLIYQWQFNGANLVDGGQFSGAATATLGIANAQTANAGSYLVVVTNVAGAATSSVATLTVNVPGICVPSPADLVGWWPGDDDASDIASTNNGTLQGGATASAPGEVGLAFTFDGVNGFVQIPDASALRPATLTIEAWVRFDGLDSTGSGGSPAGEQYLVFKQNSRSSDFEGYNLLKERTGSGDVFWFLIASAAGQSVSVQSATLITTGMWYHVAGVRGSNYVQLYINGQLEDQAVISFPQDYGNWPLYFGTSGQSYWDHKLYGALDEVSLYSRALSGSEIAAIYEAGAAGKCKALGRGAGPPDSATGQITLVTTTAVTLLFNTTPITVWAVQRSTNALGPWVTLGATNAPANGQFEWIDDFHDLGSPPSSAYYRVQEQ